MPNYTFIILIACKIAISSSLLSQPINNRFDFNNKPISKFYGLDVKSDTIYCAGSAFDSMGYLNYLFAILDGSNVLDYKLYNLLNFPSGPKTFYSFTSPICGLNGRIENFCSISYRDVCMLNIYPESDSFNYQTFQHYYAPNESFTAITDWKPTADSGYIVVYNARSTQIPGAQSGIIALRLDRNLQIVWQRVYHFTGYEAVDCVLQTNDGGFVIGGNNYDYSVQGNYWSQGFVFKINYLGNLEWQFSSNISQFWSTVFDIVEDPTDGCIVGISAHGREENGNIYYYPFIFKVDSNSNLLWKTSIGNGTYGLSPNYFNCLSVSNEEDGYVAAGAISSNFNGNYNKSGWIGKVSLSGDSIWARSVSILNDSVILDDHSIEDIVPDPHGNGYWLAGSVANKDGTDPPHQRSWLLKIDNYGCLVPGCNNYTDVVDLDKFDSDLLLYPNPTKEQLSVVLKGNLIASDLKHLGISDIYGTIILKMETNSLEYQYVIPLEELPKGVYYLWITDENGKVLSSKPFSHF
ncbi:MAG: T9SS type A sorting domain-containing protein [Lewinellaceae bacterium]|nr:T9SS type A sorting domain-containing protein [Lewinellaceae bacterium]